MHPETPQEPIYPLQIDGASAPKSLSVAHDLPEQQTREADTYFAAVVRASGDAIIGLALDGTIESWNPAAERMFGYPAAEAVGRRIALLASPDLHAEQAELMAHVRSGRSVSVETQRVTKDGRPLDVILNVAPVMDAVGRMVGAASTVTDITARKTAEAAVRHSEARLRALLDKGTDMITVSDRDGVILYASPTTERVSGYTAAEFRGSNPFVESIHPEDAARCRDAFARLLATPGLSLSLQHRARHKSGEWRWFEGTFTSLFHDPAVGGLVANVRDITHRKRAEEERERLLRAEQAARAEAEAALDVRDQFLTIASHELRTPLTSLMGYATMLQQKTLEGKDVTSQARMVAMILRQAERLNALTSKLLDVSRLQSGQFALEQQSLDLCPLVARIVDDFRLTLPANGARHRIELRCPDAPVDVLGDPLRLEEALQNLLGNAVKYSPDGGLIRVRLAHEAAAAILEVVDEGIGVPAEAQERLFEPFYRAGNVGGGTSGFGMGLYVVCEIVQRHGGRIEVESSEGAGSRFRVVLPLLTSAA